MEPNAMPPNKRGASDKKPRRSTASYKDLLIMASLMDSRKGLSQSELSFAVTGSRVKNDSFRSVLKDFQDFVIVSMKTSLKTGQAVFVLNTKRRARPPTKAVANKTVRSKKMTVPEITAALKEGRLPTELFSNVNSVFNIRASSTPNAE